MGFNDIPPIETSAAYLDRALKKATKRLAAARKRLRGDPSAKLLKIEQQRLQMIASELTQIFLKIPQLFPNFDTLSEFYTALIDVSLDREKLKQGLGAMQWVAKQVKALARQYSKELAAAESRERILTIKRRALGRISSVVKQVEKELRLLAKARTTLRSFPNIKEGLFTVAIAGFPNVGKSTLLSKVTTAKPEIGGYAFTTKSLNIGYFTHRHNKVQCIDTPGTLAREAKMNAIERQAHLAMKYAANVIVYVYDLTETYPLHDQQRLERAVRKFGKEVLLYVSKTDLLPEGVAKKFRREVITSPDELQERLKRMFDEEFL